MDKGTKIDTGYFAIPFVGLTRFEDEIEETGRITDVKKEVDDTTSEKVNEALLYIAGYLAEKSVVSITCFRHLPRRKSSIENILGAIITHKFFIL